MMAFLSLSNLSVRLCVCKDPRRRPRTPVMFLNSENPFEPVPVYPVCIGPVFKPIMILFHSRLPPPGKFLEVAIFRFLPGLPVAILLTSFALHISFYARRYRNKHL
jgi:hypothetical protein